MEHKFDLILYIDFPNFFLHLNSILNISSTPNKVPLPLFTMQNIRAESFIVFTLPHVKNVTFPVQLTKGLYFMNRP